MSSTYGSNPNYIERLFSRTQHMPTFPNIVKRLARTQAFKDEAVRERVVQDILDQTVWIDEAERSL
jgi:hypothetical protein